MDNLNAYVENASQTISEVMLASAEEHTVPLAQALAPKRTGTLADSISAEQDEENGIDLVADVAYAAYLEYGTRAHDIYPRRARVLHWNTGGEDFFSKVVHHPGIPAGKYSFLGPAVEETIDEVAQDVVEALAEIIETGEAPQ